MPSIERKSIDRIKPGDRLLVDAGVFAKAGQPIDERTIQMLAKHKITYVPAISLTYEEKDALEKSGGDPKTGEDELIRRDIARVTGFFSSQRERIIEKLKSIYIPFTESDRIFWEKGKKKQLSDGILLEKTPGPLYEPDINAGSEALLSQNDFRYLLENLNSIYTQLSGMTRLEPATKGQRNRIPRQIYSSIRLQSHYDGGRLSTLGDSLIYHAVDTALYFLVTMVNINKKRIVEGLPLSEERFDPDKSFGEENKFQYHPELIVESAGGVLIHSLGYNHGKIHETLSAQPLLSRDNSRGLSYIRLLQRHLFVSRNLLRDRRDISSLARMMVSLQHEYPDGTGFPPPIENRFLHEFVRLFQIVHFYDEMVNPVISKIPYSRWEVIEFMRANSGPYKYSRDQFLPGPRFDSDLLEEFLGVLSPYYPGEKVYLFTRGKRNAPLFVGRIYGYLDSHIPLVSILKDERRGQTYRYGQMIFNIPGGNAFVLEQGKVKKKLKIDWIEHLEIFDVCVNPGDISEFEDPVFGKQRPLAKRLQVSSVGR